MSLKSSIRQAEQSIAERRARLGGAVDGITHSIGKLMVTPGALVAAGLFGAALHRDHRLHGFRLLTILKAATTGHGLARTLTTRTSTAAESTG